MTNLWPGMEKVCSQCAARGTVVDGGPSPAKCTNTASSRYQEAVGYHGDGCEAFVYPSRFRKETQDLSRTF